MKEDGEEPRRRDRREEVGKNLMFEMLNFSFV